MDGKIDGRKDGQTEGRMSQNSPLCPTGHRPFGATAQKGSWTDTNEYINQAFAFAPSEGHYLMRVRFWSQTTAFLMGHLVACYVHSLALLTKLTLSAELYFISLVLLCLLCYTCILHFTHWLFSWPHSICSLSCGTLDNEIISMYWCGECYHWDTPWTHLYVFMR